MRCEPDPIDCEGDCTTLSTRHTGRDYTAAKPASALLAKKLLSSHRQPYRTSTRRVVSPAP